MTEIWFIRHGETAWNHARRLQGWQDIELNTVGQEQARQLAIYMTTVDQAFDALYSSDLRRAHGTAEPLSTQLGLRIRTEPGLRERGFGILEGLDLDRINELAPEAAAARNGQDPTLPIEGGESLVQFQSRIIATINDIAQRHHDERVLAVTHGGALDIIWRHASGLPLHAPRPVPLLNASINRVSIEGRTWKIQEWGNIAHLASESASDIVP